MQSADIQPGVAAGSSSKRPWIILVAAVLAVAGAAIGGFLYGQSTRLSDAEVEERVTEQASYDKRYYDRKRQAALGQLEEQLEATFARRLENETAEARAEGQAAGEAAGYSAGQAAGFESGESKGQREGEAEGYAQGFDEGLCVDPVTFDYVC